MDKNNQNILYENLDMLSVMESCDDNSVDLILLFMPPNMGGTVGESALRPYVDREAIKSMEDAYRHQVPQHYAHRNLKSMEKRQWDYGDCYFINEESFDAYMDMTKKVIQNAGRVLKKEGMLCFGIPLHFGYIERIEKDKTNFEMLLKQLFCSVGVMKVENFSTHENIDPRGYGVSTTYRLYFCTNGSEFIPINGVSELLRLPNEHQIYSDIYNSKERATKILAYAEERKRAKDRFLARGGPISVRHIFIPELRPHSLETCASEFSKEESFFGQQGYTEDNNMKVRIIKCASLPENITPLAESVMLTYCKEGDSALFPYDRDAQYASIADKLHIKWTALYKKSCNGYGGCGTDFLSRIPSGHYATYKEPIKQSCVKYRSNLVSSAADANQITKQLTEYTDLMSQVIQCASDNGWDNSGDMEDAVHALISLAVKSHAGSIVGDEAEKWFGEGWEQLSEPCRNYLQTAAAYGAYISLLSNLEERIDFPADDAEVLKEQCKAYERQIEKLKAETERQKQELYQVQKALTDVGAKSEKQAKTQAAEKQELNDLRELVFALTNDADSDKEEVKTKTVFPYHTTKKHIVFGGHPTWLKAIKPLLPDVRFIEGQPSSEQVKGAEVVWLQTNYMSHKAFYKIIDIVRSKNIPLRYFTSASATKGAEQVVAADNGK